MDRRKV